MALVGGLLFLLARGCWNSGFWEALAAFWHWPGGGAIACWPAGSVLVQLVSILF